RISAVGDKDSFGHPTLFCSLTDSPEPVGEAIVDGVDLEQQPALGRGVSSKGSDGCIHQSEMVTTRGMPPDLVIAGKLERKQKEGRRPVRIRCEATGDSLFRPPPPFDPVERLEDPAAVLRS